MFLTNNQSFLNFDRHIDINGLLSIKPFISAFIAKNHHLLKPTKYVSANFATANRGIGDYYYDKNIHQELFTDPNTKDIVTDLLNCDQLGNYVIFEHEVTMGTFSIVPRYCKNYHTKCHKNECVALPEDSNLTFFYDWLDKQNIFSDYGRVTIFINYPGTATATHKDYPNVDQANSDEFIWLSFNDRKKFFLIDAETQQKIYLSGHCNWFNTGNFHGTDPVDWACYSIRVDGVFSDDFKQRAITA